MSEFVNRVEAQRHILKIVNANPQFHEELFSLSKKGIDRWVGVNRIDSSSPLVQLLYSASGGIFVMATLSEDPIAEEYRLSETQLSALSERIKAACC